MELSQARYWLQWRPCFLLSVVGFNPKSMEENETKLKRSEMCS